MGERGEGEEEGEEEVFCNEDDDAFPCSRPLKRRKIRHGPLPTSTHISPHAAHPSAHIGSSPTHTQIKVVTPSDQSPQETQSGSGSSSSTCTRIKASARRQGTSRFDESCPSHAHLHHTKFGSSSTHTQVKVLGCPQGTLPSEPYPLHAPYLPHDLIISSIVASRFPLLDLIRSRAVCRAWRDSIFSPIIADSFFANLDCKRPWLFVEHSSPLGPSLAVYDCQEAHWSVVPMPSFGRLVAASSGLFCYVTEAGRPPSLVVGNPLTKRWKHLPAIPLCVPAHGPQIVAMIANTLAGSYKVMVLFGMWNDDATDAYLPFMYDSVSGNWVRRSTISARLSFATARSVVKSPDTLLSVDSNAGNLLLYNMTNNVAHTTQLRHLPSLINEEDPKTNLWRRLPQIAICEGVLFLVARCLGGRAPECKLGQLPIVQHSSVGVWTMKASFDDWDFITCVPLDLLEKLVKGSDGTDFIIASNGGSKLFFVLKGSPHMLAYDSTLHTWTLFPGCPAEYNSCPLHKRAFYEPLLWVSAL
eukprot:c14381_g1_i1 orf=183-1766(-)